MNPLAPALGFALLLLCGTARTACTRLKLPLQANQWKPQATTTSGLADLEFLHARHLVESQLDGYPERCAKEKHCADQSHCSSHGKACDRGRLPRLEYLLAIPVSGVLMVACFACNCAHKRLKEGSLMGNAASVGRERQGGHQPLQSAGVIQYSDNSASENRSAEDSLESTESCPDEVLNNNGSKEVLQTIHSYPSATIPEDKYAILSL